MSDLVAHLFDDDNDWSLRTRPRFNDLPPHLTDLMVHLGSAVQFWDYRYKMDAAWKRRTKALLKAEGADELVRYAVRELAQEGSFHGMTDARHVIRELGQRKPSSPARGLALGFTLAAGWLSADVSAPAADLAMVARKNAQAMDVYYRVDDGLAGAAFAALGELPGLAVMEELWTLHYCVPRARHAQKVLVKSVKKAAARLGVPPHEVAERTVPSHGLTPEGTLTLGWMERGALWSNVPFDAVITVHDTGRVTLDWLEKDGTATRSTAPFRSPTGYKARTGAYPEDIEGVRRHAQAIEKTLTAERARLAALAGEQRTWRWEDWRRYYHDHPITGPLARQLAWEYEAPDRGGYRPLDGTAQAPPPGATVRLQPATD